MLILERDLGEVWGGVRLGGMGWGRVEVVSVYNDYKQGSVSCCDVSVILPAAVPAV